MTLPIVWRENGEQDFVTYPRIQLLPIVQVPVPLFTVVCLFLWMCEWQNQNIVYFQTIGVPIKYSKIRENWEKEIN